MKPITKADLISLRNQIDGWSLKPTKMFMSQADYDELKLWSLSPEEYIISIMKTMESRESVKKYFVTCIKEGRNLDALRRVVHTNYPHYLEMLDKLLVLR